MTLLVFQLPIFELNSFKFENIGCEKVVIADVSHPLILFIVLVVLLLPAGKFCKLSLKYTMAVSMSV